MRNRICAYALLLLAATARSLPGAEAIDWNKYDRPERPNILWIIADDLGWGDLGCYGQTRIKTPNIDRLAYEGQVFTHCYVASPDNLANRAAIQTGRHPTRLRLSTSQPVTIEPEFPTAGQLLKSAGYRTGYIGKWALGSPGHFSVPEQKGYEEWIGFLRPQECVAQYPLTLHRNDPQNKFRGEVPLVPNHGGKAGMFVQDVFTKAATNFVRIYHPYKYNKFQPFFLVLSFTLPNPVDFSPPPTNAFAVVPSTIPFTGEKWSAAEKQKAAAIVRLDRSVGDVMKVLEIYKQHTNTVVFFTSDGGPFSGRGVSPGFQRSAGSFKGAKGDLEEGGLRVPLIARWPGFIPSGRTNDLMISQMDLLSTSLEFGKTPQPKGTDGISFRPLLIHDKQTNRHNFLHWEMKESVAIRKGIFKGTKLSPDSEWTVEHVGMPSRIKASANIDLPKPNVFEAILADLKKQRADGKD